MTHTYTPESFDAAGRDGELRAAELLAAAGFIVFFDPNHEYHDTDLCVAPGIEVEVKTSVLRRVNAKSMGYQFCLYRVGHSKPIHEPVVILLCETPTVPVPFIIPSEIIAQHHSISISCTDPYRYNNRWSYFRNRFDFLVKAGATKFHRGFVTADRELFDSFAPAEVQP